MQQNASNRSDPKKKEKEQSQTVIIPRLSPEVLEQARRAAAAGTPMTDEQVEAAAGAAQAEQAAREAQAAQPAPKKPRPAPPEDRAARRKKALAEAQAELEQNVRDDHLWLNNPVMMRGLGLAPLVLAATNGGNALMLCVASILLLTPTRVLAVALCHLTGNRFRPVIYCYSAALLYIPAYLILYWLFGAGLSVLGIYLPILVVEPAIVKRLENPALETMREALRRGVNNTLGLCIALLLIGGLREFLATGTLFGNTILNMSLLPIAAQPAGGFILIGIVAAFWNGIANSYIDYKQREVKAYYADQRR